ncbi:MAG: AAA family ATPase [Candidatus Komeilibacteria bacterium]|nr:AAA family ATPase [Candidatus Komeilibacteria bacterium]
MFLEKVEIQGFKSFADKTTLTFNRELTAIVGPNGSGKSNTAEAVRWALGEQSLKTLRTKKSEEVIFTGSDKRSRVSLAEVNLYLNNDSGSADIDFREVVITRRLYRNGDSEYLLNGNKVRLQDIQLILAKANFGQRSYSIIGQGMIDHLVTASALERKEMFDEATGVRQYQIKKDQAEHKLALTEENMTVSQQVLNELEPRLRSLTRQIKRLEQRELTQTNLQELQHNYYGTLWHQVLQEQKNLEKPVQELTKTITEQEANLAKQQDHFTKTSRGGSQVAEFGQLQNRYQALQQQKSKLLKDLALSQSKEATELLRQGKTDQLWLTDQLSALQQQLTDLKDLQKNLTKQLTEAEADLLTQDKNHQQINGQISQAQKELEGLQIKITQQTAAPDIIADLKELQGLQTYFLNQLEELNPDDLKKAWQKICAKLDFIIIKVAPQDQQLLQAGSVTLQHEITALLHNQETSRSQIEEVRLAKRSLQEKLQFNQEQQSRLNEETKKLATLKNGQLAAEAPVVEKELANLEKELTALTVKLQNFNAQADQHKQELLDQQQTLNNLQQELNLARQELSNQQIALAKIQAHTEDLAKEIAENLGTSWLDKINQKYAAVDPTETLPEIQKLKNQLSLIGGLEDNVETEYQEVKERHDFLKQQLTDLDTASADLIKLIQDLDEIVQKKFQASFQIINEQFNSYFKVLFNGGSAKLTLIAKEEVSAEPETDDEEDDDEEDEKTKRKTIRYGIEIQATPPGKRLNSINTLSGGEKALTAIALISAIIASNPSPFVILDEVDAALDDVTMGEDGVSKLLSLKLAEAEQIAQ